MQISKRYLRNFVLSIFLFLAFALIKDAEAVKYYWTTETVDSTGIVGQYTSIALDSSNKAYISYRDFTNADLKYATNASGSWVLEIVDSAALVGEFTSIALDSSNKAYISYRDGNNGDLKYATNASGSWVLATVDSTGTVGQYTSIAVDNAPTPKAYISYHDTTNNDLKYATNASGAFGTVDSTIQTVDSTGLVGTYTSIALDSNKKAYISYFDDTNDDLKYATNASDSWVLETVDSTGTVGDFTSIAVDNAPTPKAYISYRDVTNVDLKYATNASGSWVTETVDTAFVGSDTSIALDSSNKAYVSYFDSGNTDLKFATNVSGSWATQTVDSTNNVGQNTSIALDSSKNVYISYRDATNQDLKYAFGEVGNLVAGANTNVLINSGAGSTDGVTASSISVTADGRIRRATASASESDFLAASFIGDTFMRLDLVLDDTALTSDATVVINYTSALSDAGFISGGWSEDQLQIFRIPTGGGTPTQLTVLSRDTAANTITVTVSGFSTFAVGVNPEPATLLLLGSALLGLLPRKRKF